MHYALEPFETSIEHLLQFKDYDCPPDLRSSDIRLREGGRVYRVLERVMEKLREEKLMIVD